MRTGECGGLGLTAETGMPELGADREPFLVQHLETLREHSLAMLERARRSLDVISRDLDARVYDQAHFLDRLRALAANGGRTRVRVLVRDVDAAVKSGHRLLELARRLPSFIEIRRLGSEDADFAEALLLVDNLGYLRRPVAERYEAEGCYHDPVRARELGRRFEELWSRSDSDPNFRRLYV